MDRTEEKILIVRSVKKTPKEDCEEAQEAIASYRSAESSVSVRPRVFDVPAGASPGTMLGTNLTKELSASIGAVVFVDDLRPNVAYETGFFHGRGTRVLLVTRRPVDSVWRSISDLAGAPIVHVEGAGLSLAVHKYLTQLYQDLAGIDCWPAITMPMPAANLLERCALSGPHEYHDDGQFGPWLRVSVWGPPVELVLEKNLSPSSRFTVVVRGEGAHLTFYFEVDFHDRNSSSSRKRIWLGLTSTRRTTHIQSEERTIPARRPTTDWSIYTGTLDRLLENGGVLGSGPVEYVKRMRFRAGERDERHPAPIDVGFVSISSL